MYDTFYERYECEDDEEVHFDIYQDRPVMALDNSTLHRLEGFKEVVDRLLPWDEYVS